MVNILYINLFSLDLNPLLKPGYQKWVHTVGRFHTSIYCTLGMYTLMCEYEQYD